MRYVRVEWDGQLREARLEEWTEEGALEVTWLDRPLELGGTPRGSSVRVPREALRAPLRPGKIVCVGQNYRKHAAELGKPVPDEPLLFLKAPSAVIGPYEAIRRPPESERVDHEGELGVVIGRRMSDVAAADTLAHVLGYVAANDVTARDLQWRDVQFTRAKSFDSFCPVGPFIETDLDPADVRIEVRVNDALRQDGHTSDMVFPLPHLLAYISAVMTLEPGDLVLTGTPSGVGPLNAGDVVRVALSGLGTLENPVTTRTRSSDKLRP
ncbi:MAG: fumarylacetoacetate hydrolase family protein [Sandaracinaceae bacterium]|nr:fumarylacetoacetate hydrolase family protein [Sandaracinaceae bacterium]